MIRQAFIERVLRAVYDGQPTDDSSITINLVNAWMNDAIGIVAKLNYKEGIQIDGIAYLNNSFYTTFKGLTFTKTENFIYQTTLPQIPFGLGKNEGTGSMNLKDASGNISLDVLWLSVNQVSYYKSMPPIPNKILGWPEGIFVYLISTLGLDTGYTANLRMASGGDSTNLNSVLNVPDDYIPAMIEYCTKMLLQERAAPKIVTNQGDDA